MLRMSSHMIGGRREMLRLYLVMACILPTWNTLGQGGEVLRGDVEAEMQSGPTELEAVYRNRAYDPIWINELGRPGPGAETLIDILATSESHGLDSDDTAGRICEPYTAGSRR